MEHRTQIYITIGCIICNEKDEVQQREYREQDEKRLKEQRERKEIDRAQKAARDRGDTFLVIWWLTLIMHFLY